MTLTEQLLTIAVVVCATMLTRFTPFLLFSARSASKSGGKRQTPAFIQYLGRVLPAAVFGMLVVYCLKQVPILTAPHGLPELIALAAVVGLHLWKKQMLLSIAGGTVLYMVLLQTVF